MRTGTTVRAAVLGTATLMMITACGSGGGGAEDTGVPPADADLTVVTGVYPLEWLAREIGGDGVAVTQLTEPGTEPHDLELTGRQVGEVSEADIAFFVGGLQPAVDDAISQEASDSALDVGDVVHLRPAGGEDEEHGDEEHAHEDEHGHEDEHAHEEEEGEEEHDHGEHDPHFWLDVELMAETARALGERMGEVHPEGADAYEQNVEAVTAELEAIGQEYEEGLASCEHHDVVVGHTAFTYLTEAYGLEQVGVSGVDPDTEPSPSQIAAITDIVRERDITTVFTEPLMPPETAETIASETGAEVRVLDPLEGVTEDSPGDDYPSIMRGNLAALTTALGCS
ncbi:MULTISPECIES: metal ABC transporter substrate-binding protein [Nocardiopsidaceae]|uniref:Metal ABC transporter substrate-binding protein n=1 Tax=Streptomonospora nanhaiensis TaxID=1323731 RepID=A0ABY6YJG7_9ACTN|nr:metal ABC transporter substrate-binding protein [Streptomonospora nanhaiensis]WAE72363.1 metal ABC transporter substrate-binding protein [Streptomonospora nanhaiensis]